MVVRPFSQEFRWLSTSTSFQEEEEEEEEEQLVTSLLSPPDTPVISDIINNMRRCECTRVQFISNTPVL